MDHVPSLHFLGRLQPLRVLRPTDALLRPAPPRVARPGGSSGGMPARGAGPIMGRWENPPRAGWARRSELVVRRVRGPAWSGPQPAPLGQDRSWPRLVWPAAGSGETRCRVPPGTGAAERVPCSLVEGPSRSGPWSSRPARPAYSTGHMLRTSLLWCSLRSSHRQIQSSSNAMKSCKGCQSRCQLVEEFRHGLQKIWRLLTVSGHADIRMSAPRSRSSRPAHESRPPVPRLELTACGASGACGLRASAARIRPVVPVGLNYPG